jgi:hypothetical protein
MEPSAFRGPLFIIGLPRSGTKLLRDLLNQNPQIGIPVVETHFIPKLVKKFGAHPAFNKLSEFNEFTRQFQSTTFYLNFQKQGKIISIGDLRQATQQARWNDIFEMIIRFFTPPNKVEGFIWGDKTPNYINHIPLLKSIFPAAKFLHIIRDPRDYCLSVRKVWGKHLYRSATLWKDQIEIARQEGKNIPSDYLEIYYESLLEDPEYILMKICSFIECTFTRDMLRLQSSSERIGDARGKTEILSGNKGKYKYQLSVKRTKRIEEIVFPVLITTPFSVHYANIYRPVSPVFLRLLKIFDGWQSLKFHLATQGMIQGSRYFFLLHQENYPNN